jgi:hypothetical protein
MDCAGRPGAVQPTDRHDPFIVFDTRFCSPASIAVSRLPVFATSRHLIVLLDGNVLGVNTPFPLTLT